MKGEGGELLLPYPVKLFSIPPGKLCGKGSVSYAPVEFGMKGGRPVVFIGIPPKDVSDKGGNPKPPVQLEDMFEVKGGGGTLALIGNTCEDKTGKEPEDTLVKSGGLRYCIFGALVLDFDGIRVAVTGSSVFGVNVMGIRVIGGDVTGVNVVRAEVTGNLVGITCEDKTGKELEDALVKSGGFRYCTFDAIVVDFDGIGMVVTGSSVLGVKVMGIRVVGGDVTGINVVRAIVTGFPVVGLEVTGAFVVGLIVTGANVDGAELTGCLVVKEVVRGNFLLVGAHVGTTAGTEVVGILVFGGIDCKGRPCVPVKDAGAVVRK